MQKLTYSITSSVILGAIEGRSKQWEFCPFYNAETDTLEAHGNKAGKDLLFLLGLKRKGNDIYTADARYVGHVK